MLPVGALATVLPGLRPGGLPAAATVAVVDMLVCLAREGAAPPGLW